MNKKPRIWCPPNILFIGAIVAQPIQEPKTGLLPGIVILFCVLGLQRLSSKLSFRSKRIQSLAEGNVALLVKDEKLASSFIANTQHLACKNCGNVVDKQEGKEQPCKLCKENDWEPVQKIIYQCSCLIGY
ncbi:MAG: hypothetical protein E3K32_04195 [wastewater metagenome]|nr:hypothetical protein [Candidatus Loosdrechtia aerotolerans]